MGKVNKDQGKEGTTPSKNGDEGFIDGFESYELYSRAVIGSLVKCVKNSLQVKMEQSDYEYFNTLPEFKEMFEGNSGRLINLMQAIAVQYQGHGAEPVDLEGMEDDEARFEAIVDVMDEIMEKTNKTVDAFDQLRKGAKSKEGLIEGGDKSSGIIKGKLQSSETGKKYNFVHSKAVLRPQLQFQEPVDNTYNTPWFPKLHTKFNALVPLQDFNALFQSKPDEILQNGFENPYAKELSVLTPLPEFWTESKEEILYENINESECKFVDSVDGLNDMLSVLKECKEFAVDLEHHNYRSFQGFTCLMQVSTRKDDFIVDTIALRSEMHILNGVFTDPSILKVLHGANQDIFWLQKDLGIYVVNMFDTGQAARVLELPSASLAYLLDFYCGVKADKKYQLADWRIRPLPEEMFKYAREDTHYLLYVYDRLRNQLIDRGNSASNLALAVFNRSVELCSVAYKKPVLDGTSYLDLYAKYNRNFNANQLSVFKSLFEWRDAKAREEDEGLHYVLPNHMLLKLSEAMPEDTTEVFACCNPVPTFVKLNSNDLVHLISKAKVEKVDENCMRQVLIKSSKRKQSAKPSNAEPESSTNAKPVVVNEAPSAISPMIVKQGKYNISGKFNVTPPAMATGSRLRGVLKPDKGSNKNKLFEILAKVSNAMKDSPILSGFKFDGSVVSNSKESKDEKVITELSAAMDARQVEGKPMKRAGEEDEASLANANQESKEDDSAEAKLDKDIIFNLREMKSSSSGSKGNKRKPNEMATTANEKEDKEEESNEGFEPFDYAKASQVFTEAANDSTEKHRKKKQRTYNPYTDVVEPTHKKTPKANLAPKSGVKSYTYSQEGGKSAAGGKRSQGGNKKNKSKVSWPKK
eukprot:Nk52_evm104s226 gene=Nk52_evmTU104s226